MSSNFGGDISDWDGFSPIGKMVNVGREVDETFRGWKRTNIVHMNMCKLCVWYSEGARRGFRMLVYL